MDEDGFAAALKQFVDAIPNSADVRSLTAF
jgi:hypothetical protein